MLTGQPSLTPLASTSECTLYDPDRLEAAIATFTNPEKLKRAMSGQIAKDSQRHRGEAFCRQVLEAMLRMRLPKARPKWCVNPVTRRPLELDMYNQEHKLAFEYDGAQHAVYTPHYHGNQSNFEYRRLLDKLKAELCKKEGVRLVRIPWHQVQLRDPEGTVQNLRRILQASQGQGEGRPPFILASHCPPKGQREPRCFTEPTHDDCRRQSIPMEVISCKRSLNEYGTTMLFAFREVTSIAPRPTNGHSLHTFPS